MRFTNHFCRIVAVRTLTDIMESELLQLREKVTNLERRIEALKFLYDDSHAVAQPTSDFLDDKESVFQSWRLRQAQRLEADLISELLEMVSTTR